MPDQAEIDDSDEEFFDAEEPSSEELAEGRDKQLDLKMLKYPERNIFIPGFLEFRKIIRSRLIDARRVKVFYPLNFLNSVTKFHFNLISL